MTVNQTTIGERMRQVLDGRCVGAAFAVAGLLAVATATVAPSAAFGGQWMRTTCTNPDGSPAGSEGWTGFVDPAAPPSSGSTNKATCGPDDPMYAFLGDGSRAPVGAAEGLAYTPPEGSTLAGGTAVVGLSARGYGFHTAARAVMLTPAYSYDATNLFVNCVMNVLACQDEKPDYVGTVELPSNRGGSLYLAAGCTGDSQGAFCDRGGDPVRHTWSSVAVASANLLLATEEGPSGSDFSGSVLDPGVSGTVSLRFTASDKGPGVLKVTVTVDGNPLYDATPNGNFGKCVPGGRDAGTGAYYFQWQQPCPRSQVVDLGIRTTQLSDGPHELKVIVINAAQDASTVLRRTITTRNNSSVSSIGTTPRPAPGGAGMPAPAYSVELDAATKKLVRGVRTGWAQSGLRLAGTLRTSTGVAAPNVRVTLFARNGREGSPVAVARATTDAAGHWAVSAPRGPSRSLAIVYGEQPDSASPNAIRIRQTVRPGLTLRVQALGRGRLRFSGKLSIKPLGSPRPLVIIQTRTRNGKHWQAVGTSIRVKPSGAYSVVYDGGRNVIGGTYSFRTVANATSLFATATSPIRRKAVR
jgi:hypothetical protein